VSPCLAPANSRKAARNDGPVRVWKSKVPAEAGARRAERVSSRSAEERVACEEGRLRAS
jgi:hypothetical protein